MDAVLRYHVAQYDGTVDGANDVMRSMTNYIGWERETVAGVPTLYLLDWWSNRTPVLPTDFCCNNQIYPDRASLDAAVYVLPEGS